MGLDQLKNQAPPPVIRDELEEAHEAFWTSLEKNGEFLTAQQRIRVANATRGSPPQNPADMLPDAMELAVRFMSTHAWDFEEKNYNDLVGENDPNKMTPGQFVEMVAVAAMTIQIDTMDLALGRGKCELPSPPANPEPCRGQLDPLCKADFNSWVPVLPPPVAKAGSKVFETYFNGRGESLKPEVLAKLAQNYGNIMTQLSAAPEDHAQFNKHLQTMYIKFERETGGPTDTPPGRAIARPQIELLATQVSLCNQCGY